MWKSVIKMGGGRKVLHSPFRKGGPREDEDVGGGGPGGETWGISHLIPCCPSASLVLVDTGRKAPRTDLGWSGRRGAPGPDDPVAPPALPQGETAEEQGLNWMDGCSARRQEWSDPRDFIIHLALLALLCAPAPQP